MAPIFRARAASIAVIVFVLCFPLAIARNARAAARQDKPSAQTGPASSASPPTAADTHRPPASDPALAAAESLVQRGLLKEAEAQTRHYLDAHPESADGHYLLGYILFDEIHQEYLAEERKEGAGFRYNDTVGRALAQMRDAKARESLAEFSAGARYHPASAFDLKIVALDYLLLKDEPAAEKWLTASVKLNPRDAQAWFYLGRTQYSETKYAAAIEAFEQCLKLEPRNVAAEYNVGLSYEGLNQKPEAIQAYQNAIAWQAQSPSKSPEPFMGLARLYLNQNQPAKAVPYLVQAVAAFPQAALAHEELGRAYSSLNKLREAQKELEEAVELSPQKASLRCVLGQVYQREKMPAKAKIEFDRCAALQNTQATPAATPQPQPH